MPDMLIKLFELVDDWGFMAAQKEYGITIRKPIGPETHLIVGWVSDQFGAGWAAETEVAMSNRPRSCFVAVKDSMIIGLLEPMLTHVHKLLPSGLHATVAQGFGVFSR